MSLNVIYQSDNNYAPYMGVSILSLLENNKDLEHLTIYIIDDGIDSENKKKLLSTAAQFEHSLTFLETKAIFEDKKNQEAFSYVGFRKNKHSYLKMYLGQLLPDVHGKILYIDCDTVVTGSLSEIQAFELEGAVIAMVQDSLMGNSKTSIGLRNTDRYYNSGVILFDIDLWREKKCFERIINHITNIRTYGTVDQDVLNMELKEEIATLPLKYNVQSIHRMATPEQFAKYYKHKEPFYSLEEIRDACEHPVILHFLRFAGEHPWDQDTVHPDKKSFDKYLQNSEWKEMKKGQPKAGMIFKLEKWMFQHLPRGLFLFIFSIIHEHMVKKSNEK